MLFAQVFALHIPTNSLLLRSCLPSSIGQRTRRSRVPRYFLSFTIRADAGNPKTVHPANKGQRRSLPRERIGSGSRRDTSVSHARSAASSRSFGAEQPSSAFHVVPRAVVRDLIVFIRRAIRARQNHASGSSLAF